MGRTITFALQYVSLPEDTFSQTYSGDLVDDKDYICHDGTRTPAARALFLYKHHKSFAEILRTVLSLQYPLQHALHKLPDQSAMLCRHFL